MSADSGGHGDRDAARRLLRLFPRSFREIYGEEMRDVWLQRRNEADRGSGISRFWMATIADALRGSFREHLDELGRDLRFAARRLLGRPVFAIVALLSLALGMGATVGAFTLLKTAFLDPIPGVEPSDRLVNLKTLVGPLETFELAPWPIFEQIVIAADTRATIAGFHGTMASLRIGEASEPQVAPAQIVTPSYFEVLGLHPSRGRFFTEETQSRDEAVAVVSRWLWENRLGRTALGSGLWLNGRRFEIVGVGPEGFRGHFKAFHFDVFVPASAAADLGVSEPRGPESEWVEMVARLDRGVAPDSLQAALEGVEGSIAKSATDEWRELDLIVEPLTGIDADLRGGALALLASLFVVSLAALAIAGLNVAALNLGDMTWRRREMAVRRALGAPPGRLARQILVESGLLAVLAAALGGGVAVLVVRLAGRSLADLDPRLALNLRLDPLLLVAAGALVLATAVVAGTAPARLAVTSGVHSLRVGSAPAQTSRFLGAVVVAQIVLSFSVLASAATLGGGLRRAASLDPGFRHDGVFAVSLDPALAAMQPTAGEALLRRARDEIDSLPGVASAALTDRVPLSIGAAIFPRPTEIGIPGLEPPSGRDGFPIEHAVVSSGYLRTLAIELEAGRDFLPSGTPEGPRSAIVNGSFVERFFADGRALGRRLRHEGRDLIVVGVARDSRYRRLDEPSTPFVYLSWHERSPRRGTLLVRSAAGAPPAIRQRLRELAPELPISELGPLDDLVAASLGPRRVAAATMSALGLLGLTLTAGGLSGVLATWVGRRRRELGLRLSLGATPTDLRRLVLRHALRIAGLGVALGLPAAWFVTRLLRGLVPDAPSLRLGVLGATAVVLLLSATAAAIGPARRAGRADPMAALRED